MREDASALDRIFADEFIYTSTTGALINKAQQLEAIKSGDLKIEFGKSDEVRVRVYGNTFTVEYKLRRYSGPQRIIRSLDFES